MIYIKIKTASDVLNLCDIIVVWLIQDYHDIFFLKEFVKLTELSN